MEIRLSWNGVEVKCSAPKFKFVKTFYQSCASVSFLERAYHIGDAEYNYYWL